MLMDNFLDYNLNVLDDNNCIQSSEIEIFQPEILTTNINITPPACSGYPACVTIDSFGGTVDNYTYTFYQDGGNQGPSNNCTPEPEDLLVEPSTSDGCFNLVAGDYFVIKNSNVGSARSSMDYDDDSIVGIGTTFIDNVYRVAAVSGVTTDAVGFGQTGLTRVIVSIANTAGLVGLANSTFYGNYSFGRIVMSDRNVSRAYTVNTSNGITGIETGVRLTRKTSLKTESYAT